jgi:hypothetical protein
MCTSVLIGCDPPQSSHNPPALVLVYEGAIGAKIDDISFYPLAVCNNPKVWAYQLIGAICSSLIGEQTIARSLALTLTARFAIIFLQRMQRSSYRGCAAFFSSDAMQCRSDRVQRSSDTVQHSSVRLRCSSDRAQRSSDRCSVAQTDE